MIEREIERIGRRGARQFCGMLWSLMDPFPSTDYKSLYRRFQSPIAALDCGEKCSPYNEGGAPFCCDTRHAVPTAYPAEWEYLQANTNLWHIWQGETPAETERLHSLAPEGQVLIACSGYAFCQREYRSIVCRAFPFFPYITRQGEFIGLAYYWEYEDRCWVVSNLATVRENYRAEFMAFFDDLFARLPGELEVFRGYSSTMRRVFGRRKRAIPLLHRNGLWYKITPRNGRARRISPEQLAEHGPYKIAAQLPFPDESG